MSEIVINPLTRLEGHGKITIEVDDDGHVQDARYNVVYLRGFEKFLEGCFLEDLPKFTPRICGVCPVAHHMASAKACDDLLGVDLPETAEKIRRLWYAVYNVHDKALIIAGTGAPDFMLTDASQAERNVITLIKQNPELGKKILEIRKFGQESSRIIGGKAIHPFTAVPGGVSFSMQEDEIEQIKELGENAEEIAVEIVELIKGITYDFAEDNPETLEKLGNVETNYLGMVDDEGAQDCYDGKLRFMDKSGEITEFDPSDYKNYIEETTFDYSYTKVPYWKQMGYPEGTIRVGPLARINVSDKLSTPKAQEYFEDFKENFGTPAHITILYHYARAIELLHNVELYNQLIDDDAITGEDRIAENVPEPSQGRGVGVVEAPRGTLIHDYTTDEQGLAKKLKLVVATTFNNPAMDQDIKAAAEEIIETTSPDEKVLNTVEMVQRAYDPCLSCSAHSVDSKYPTVVEIVDTRGNKLREISNLED